MGTIWRRFERSGRRTGIEWHRWLTADRAIDPYLVWADLGGAAGQASDEQKNVKWPFIVELSRSGIVPPGPGCSTEVDMIFGCAEIPGDYVSVDSFFGSRFETRYLTMRVAPDMVEHLLHSGVVTRFQLGLPRIPAVDTRSSPKPHASISGAIARTVVGIIDDGCAFAHPAFLGAGDLPRTRFLWDQDDRRAEDAYWKRPSEFGYGAELGPQAIEAATALARRGELEPYRLLRYGRFRLEPDVHSSSPLDIEGAVPQGVQAMATHGTSVMDLAAGYPPAPRAQRAPGAWPQDVQGRTDFQDAGRNALAARIEALVHSMPTRPLEIDRVLASLDTADQWRMVFVQLPTRTVADTSGGSLAVHVLDGVRYILRSAGLIPYEHLGTAPKQGIFNGNPVVINLSWGATGGGHDGTSILERALLERAEQANHPCWIVVAAGNAHRARTHAEMELKPGGRRSLSWVVGPDNPLEAFLELWLPSRDVEGQPVFDRLSRELMVDVTAPDGRGIVRATLGDIWLLGDGTPAAALVWCRRVAQSEHGTMILLAAAATRGNLAPHGEWRVDLAWGHPDAVPAPPVRVQAWCERNDLVYGGRRRQQSHVLADQSMDEPSEWDPEVRLYQRDLGRGMPDQRRPYGLRPVPALSSVAAFDPPDGDLELLSGNNTGRAVTVGAYRLADDEVSRDSSGGPSRLLSDPQTKEALKGRIDRAVRTRPDVAAAADYSVAVPGLRTSGTWAGTVARISGTSAAAAAVSRMIANIQYWESAWINRSTLGKATALRLRSLLVAPREGEEPPAARATLTPTIDDGFRRGARRVR